MSRSPYAAALTIAALLLAPRLANGDERPLDELVRAASAGTPADQERALDALAIHDAPRAALALKARFLAAGADPHAEYAGLLLSERHVLHYARALADLVAAARRERVVPLLRHACRESARYLRALDLWAALELDPFAAATALADLIGDGDAPARIRAIELLALCGADADGRPLLPLLEHTDVLVRIEVLLALAKLRACAADALLAQCAVRDTDARARRHAVWALYERGGAAGLARAFEPHVASPDPLVRTRAAEALALERLRDPVEEGPIAFRYKGSVANVLALVRAAETERPAQLAATDPEARARIERTLALLDARAPKFAFFVRHSLRKITTEAAFPTGTYVATRVFNIKPATAREWSVDHLAKTLVHDSTHAYLWLMGEKSGEHRGEAECFEEAFWAECLLTGRPETEFSRELDTLLAKAHWTRARDY